MRNAFVRLAALAAGATLASGFLVAAADAPEPEPVKATALDTRGDADTVGEVQGTSSDPITEDDPRWDCRTMGNQTCGVVISGTWYLVTFADGEPVAVTPR